MFDKAKIKSNIKKLEKKIDLIEQKRSRSQSALVQAILQNTEPDEKDVEYFNNYSAEIDSLRTEMRELKISLTVGK